MPRRRRGTVTNERDWTLGRPARYVDGQIAAIAHVRKLVLVTANTRDFSRFTDLKVENWSKTRARS